MMPLHLSGKVISYILMVGRQKNVALYLSEYMIAAVVALVVVSALCNVILGVQNILGIVWENNLIVFLLVVVCISIFSFLGKK